jgi:glycosyltransferase involved in cell wall biosynthesis
MKIAVITGEYWPYIGGGRGVSVTLLAQQLRNKGIDVDVYLFRKLHSPILTNSKSIIHYNVINERLWPLVNLQTVEKLWKVLTKYDIVHVYSTIQIAALGFLRRTMLRIPVVATLNGEVAACISYQRWMKFKCKKCNLSDAIRCALDRAKKIETLYVPAPVLATYFIIQRALAQNLDRYFALSNTIKSIYVACGFPEDKIMIIPNMYDPVFMKKLEQINIIKRNEKVIIFYAGRLVKEKGVDDLIKAFSIVNSTKAELWIAGSGPEEKRLRQIAEKSKKTIKFLGFVSLNDIPIMYKKAHIFVHPAKWPEPFSRNILEAMLAKLAIVASDSGASPEVLGDTGIIYRTGNIYELAEKLEMLINNNKLREELGEKAFKRALSQYSPEKITHQIIKEYEKLCSSMLSCGVQNETLRA